MYSRMLFGLDPSPLRGWKVRACSDGPGKGKGIYLSQATIGPHWQASAIVAA